MKKLCYLVFLAIILLSMLRSHYAAKNDENLSADDDEGQPSSTLQSINSDDHPIIAQWSEPIQLPSPGAEYAEYIKDIGNIHEAQPEYQFEFEEPQALGKAAEALSPLRDDNYYLEDANLIDQLPGVLPHMPDELLEGAESAPEQIVPFHDEDVPINEVEVPMEIEDQEIAKQGEADDDSSFDESHFLTNLTAAEDRPGGNNAAYVLKVEWYPTFIINSLQLKNKSTNCTPRFVIKSFYESQHEREIQRLPRESLLQDFNMSDQLINELSRHWPSTVRKIHGSLYWRYVWYVYGSRMGTIPVEIQGATIQERYFTMALEIFRRLDIQYYMMSQCYIFATGSTAEDIGVLNRCMLAYQFTNVQKECEPPRQGIEEPIKMLSTLKFCFNHNGFMVDCPDHVIPDERICPEYFAYMVCKRWRAADIKGSLKRKDLLLDESHYTSNFRLISIRKTAWESMAPLINRMIAEGFITKGPIFKFVSEYPRCHYITPQKRHLKRFWGV